jgi:hypothetical protein
MKKKALIRGLIGFPGGVTICLVITIIESLIVGDGRFYACVPEFVELAGSEIMAVILQTVLAGLVGSVYGAASVIWEMEDWSIAKQSGIFFAIAAVTMMPIGYLLNWMEHSVTGIVSFYLIFLVIFVMIWITMYLIWRRKVRELNQDVQKRKSE